MKFKHIERTTENVLHGIAQYVLQVMNEPLEIPLAEWENMKWRTLHSRIRKGKIVFTLDKPADFEA